MKGQSISGAYMKENDGVYKHVKSLHLNGKFQTEFKQASLPGWYDQINPKQYVKRDEVSQNSFIFFVLEVPKCQKNNPDPTCQKSITKMSKKCCDVNIAKYLRKFQVF